MSEPVAPATTDPATADPAAVDHVDSATGADDEHAHHGYVTRKDDYLKRLRRIEGQARGIQRMVDEEKYCIDILTQISAMTKALQMVAMGLLEDHIEHCVVDAVAAGGPEAEIKLKEATDAIARLVRS
ncbi:metal-sensitive transcriptional regulator [Jongsikchunia kroppenstedtii]|uniref:metal-sensitive transcriptional regulator n=1 Tax=Jongsikchunia kroppenstedtii TaxID=1121721 RepID=UPI000372EEB2|nr:metal-sensitive transcriptional regulator [Jongsikchunia kroppenstedtii]